MKRFILKSILFLIPIAGILLTMEVYMRSLPNSYSQKNEWMKSHASEVEVLVLGNSHGLFGIRPDLLGKKAYNLCQVSQTFEYDEYLLRHFEPQLKSLTDVLLIADNSNLFDLPLEKSEWFRFQAKFSKKIARCGNSSADRLRGVYSLSLRGELKGSVR